jgi:hypothetical protein
MLTNYRWSSYPIYIGKAINPGWLTTEFILGYFGRHTLHSLRGAYRRQLEEMAALGHWESNWKETIRASVLHGSKRFVARMLEELKGNRREQSGLREKERMTLDWPKITDAVAKVWRSKWEVLSSERGSGALGLAFYLGRRYAGLRLRELGDLGGGIEYPAVSIAITRIGKRLKIDRELQMKLKQVSKLLKVEI